MRSPDRDRCALPRSCYGLFTHAEKLRRLQTASASLPIVLQPYAEARGFVEAAFEQLAKEVEENVMDGSDVVKLNTLRERFIELHQQLDEGSELVYRNDMLKKQLMARFGSAIEFWHLQDLKQVAEAQEEQSRIAHQEKKTIFLACCFSAPCICVARLSLCVTRCHGRQHQEI